MLDADRTTTQMLEGLADERNDAVWSQFDERYRPILIGFARSLGLPADDAADVAQEALARFVVEYREGKYDRDRGRLRSWLIGIVRYRVLELRRKRAIRREAHGVTRAADLEDESELTRLWEREHEAEIYRRAVRRLKETSRTDPTTLRAFELLVERQMTPQQVADELGISVEDAYRAKSRVAQRLRAIVEDIQRLYTETGPGAGTDSEADDDPS